MRLSRRSTLVAALATPFISRAARAETVIRMGTLKLIHALTPYFYERFVPDGIRIEVIAFESPSDGKAAVVTKSIDFGTFGVAAAIQGAAAREPIVVVGPVCNKGMGVVARKDSDIVTLKDLRGRRVAIWPGSTQEVFIYDRLRMEGMSAKDIIPVRVSFSEMHAALARGDVDAYVGAEPAPGVSLSTGVGKIVEYPYSTPMGALNQILATHSDTVTDRPELVRTMVLLQRRAAEYATAHPDETATLAVTKLGQKREAIALSLPNVEYTWRMTPEIVIQARTYAEHMLEAKQIKALPDMAFLNATFSDEVARVA